MLSLYISMFSERLAFWCVGRSITIIKVLLCRVMLRIFIVDNKFSQKAILNNLPQFSYEILPILLILMEVLILRNEIVSVGDDVVDIFSILKHSRKYLNLFSSFFFRFPMMLLHVHHRWVTATLINTRKLTISLNKKNKLLCGAACCIYAFA